MKKILALAAAVALVTLPVYGDFTYPGRLKQAVYQSVTADNTDVAFLVKYIGSSTTAVTITVETNGDLTFLEDGSASTALECPVSGALGGVIDVSNAACNTVGEVLDIINASATYRAVILDSLRSDDMNQSGTGLLLTQSTIDAKSFQGFQALAETAASPFTHTRVIHPCRTFDCLAPSGNVPTNLYKGTYTVLDNINVKSTYGSGTSTINIYAVKPGKNSETATLIWTEAGGNTTVYNATGAADWPIGLIGPPDSKIVVRVVNSAAMATVVAQYGGRLFQNYP